MANVKVVRHVPTPPPMPLIGEGSAIRVRGGDYYGEHWNQIINIAGSLYVVGYCGRYFSGQTVSVHKSDAEIDSAIRAIVSSRKCEILDVVKPSNVTVTITTTRTE